MGLHIIQAGHDLENRRLRYEKSAERHLEKLKIAWEVGNAAKGRGEPMPRLVGNALAAAGFPRPANGDWSDSYVYKLRHEASRFFDAHGKVAP